MTFMEPSDYDPNYFGSKLNYFINKRCRKDMVVNNIDLIIDDYKNKILRIIESKHDRETIKAGQGKLLKKLREIVPKRYKDYTIQILIIRGNYPYDTCVLEAVDGSYKKEMNQEELIKFLNGENVGS